VGTRARERRLAGLVSEEAEQLYARLSDAGWLAIGKGPDQVDLDTTPARELIDARIAYRTHSGDGRFLPVSQSTALQLLLSRHQDEIATKHRRVIEGWELLDSVLSTPAGPRSVTSTSADSLVEIITDKKTLNQLSIELYQTTQKELLGLSTNQFTGPLAKDQVLAPPQRTLSRGGQFRMIYDGRYATHLAGAQIIEASIAAGEQARVRAHLPLKMLHVDDNVALVALTPTGMDGSLLVRSPSLLAALRDWFELLWNDDATTTVGETTAVPLSATQRHVLRLLCSGLSDEAIARAMDASVRTVRRHIAVILEVLGVGSRFAAGAVAAKRGWV
jgi:DNA-binding CsgD family transcriptional regulator